MKSRVIGYVFTLIIGIIIGVLYANFFQQNNTSSVSQSVSSQTRTPAKNQPILSAKGIIPTDSLKGVVANISGNSLLVQTTDPDDSSVTAKQKIQLFSDTNIQFLDTKNPSTIKKISGSEIQIGQQVQATGKMDSEQGLLCNYMVVSPAQSPQ